MSHFEMFGTKSAINTRIQHHHWQRKWTNRLLLHTTLSILLVCLINPVTPEVVYRVDPLALLAATLRTYQRAGCDSEQLSLSCPRGTSISIELAQYGRAGDSNDHSLCPPASHEDITTTDKANDGIIRSGTNIEVKSQEMCTVTGLQYALLQTVVDSCQKKRRCKFAANSKTHSMDNPCSGIRKFVEIAYKCRPYEFRSKMACENDNMQLVCNPYSRIAIYSASFGHTERETVQCGGHNSKSMNVNDNIEKQTCLVAYATETVMQICHGRRRCSIAADPGTFGRPCKSDVYMNLKVVYTCIPRKVLKDRYETALESDEPQQTDLEMDQDDLYDEDQFYRESEAIPPTPKLQEAIPKAKFPSGYNIESTDKTSTQKTPIFYDNQRTLEVGLQTTTWLKNLIKSSNNKSHDYVGNDVTIQPRSEVPSSTTLPIELINENSMEENGKNYFYKRKCQTQDDWGTIGLNCTETDIITERVQVIGFLNNWIQYYLHLRKNQEQFYLYLIISVGIGLLLCLILVIGRLTLQKRIDSDKNSNRRSATFIDSNIDDYNKQKNATNIGPQLTENFVDDISDIEEEIDLTTSIPIPSFNTQNESYTSYNPTEAKYSYRSMPVHSSVATVLIDGTYHTGLPVTLHDSNLSGKPAAGAAGTLNNQLKPTQHPTSVGICTPSLSGLVTMGSDMMAPSSLSTSIKNSSGIPSYYAGTVVMPPHQHEYSGTMRRTLVPKNIGVVGAAATSQIPGQIPQNLISNSVPDTDVYYDSNISRTLNRGMSADHNHYFYG